MCVVRLAGGRKQLGHCCHGGESFFARHARVLILGAGALGCELLRNLAMCGVRHISIIDCDRIEVTNLNRQFLFAQEDIGRPKAIVAAEKVSRRVGQACITPYVGRIEQFATAFYQQFHVIVSGLDSVEARRWINALLCREIAKEGDGHQQNDCSMESAGGPERGQPECSLVSPLPIPLVDGGTEGLKGHVRIVHPQISACIECTLGLFAETTDHAHNKHALCTIANEPRTLQHCIEWAALVEWPRLHPPDAELVLDEGTLEWIVAAARRRAFSFALPDADQIGTRHVTTALGNIVPAVASTTAIIAGICTQHVLKFLLGQATPLHQAGAVSGSTAYNYLFYNGQDGVYGLAVDYERAADCVICGGDA